MITKCPRCSTTFNVRQQQLAAAKGLVRCGACMNIFNAIEHRAALSQSTQPENAHPSTHPNTHTSKKTADRPPTTKSKAKNNAANEQETQEKHPTKSDWANVIQADLHSIEQDLDELEKQVSPQRSKSKLLDTHRNTHQTQDQTTQLLFDDEELSESLRSLQSKEADPFTYDTEDGLQASEEYYAKIMLEKMEQEKSTPEALRSKPSKAYQEDSETLKDKKPQKPKPEQNVAFDTSKLDQDIAEFFVSSDTVSDITPLKTESSKKSQHLKDLDNLNDEPVDIDADKPSQVKHRRKRRLIYSLVILLFIGSALAQYIYYNFNTLAKSAFWRPKLEYLCTLITCQLPAVRDISKIKSQNVVTRQHPDKKDMLIANAVIYSVSEVSVPFPNINLRFTDKDGRAIDEKQFSPREYRKGDLLQLDMIPPNRAIHISIEMLDPGPAATSYTIHFSYE